MKYNFDRKTRIMIILLSMFVGAVFGYIYEVIFYKIDTGHFINRGTTFGPWIPIYAYGTLLIYLTTNKQGSFYRLRGSIASTHNLIRIMPT